MTESYRFKEFHVREDMVEALERYVEHGLMPGGFLQAVLSNQLVEAAMHADHWNLPNLPAFAAYVYNKLPSQCWGSPEKIETWAAHRGLAGALETIQRRMT